MLRRLLTSVAVTAALLLSTAAPTPLARPAEAQAIRDMAQRCHAIAKFAADVALGIQGLQEGDKEKEKVRLSKEWRDIYDAVFAQCLRLNVTIPERLEQNRKSWRWGMAQPTLRPDVGFVGGGYFYGTDERGNFGTLLFADRRVRTTTWWIGRSGDWHYFKSKDFRTETTPGWSPYVAWGL